MPHTSATRPARRIPVSLRLPPRIATAVDAFAAERDMSKTDAYLELIEKGLDAVGTAGNVATDIRVRLDEILELLRTNQDSAIHTGLRGKADCVDRGDDHCRVVQSIADAAAENPAIKRAYLFGSFARGAQTASSDIDIRLEIDRSRGFNLHDLAHFMKLIEQQTGRSVDVVSADVIHNERLGNAIEREKVLVYERAKQ